MPFAQLASRIHVAARLQSLPALAALLVTGLAVLALDRRHEGVRQRLCYGWSWRELESAHVALALAPGFALFAAGWWLLRRHAAARPVLPVALFTLACLALQAGGVAADPAGFEAIALRAESSGTTGYLDDAGTVRAPLRFLRGFDRRPDLHLHSLTHPPGPILYYRAWIGLVGRQRAAAVGAWTIAVLACGVVPLVYALAGLWTSDPRARAAASALWALLPSVIAFVPEFDQVYAGIAIGLVLLGERTLAGARWAPLAFGALAAVALFFAWNFLALAPIGLLASANRIRRSDERGRTARRLAFASATVVGVIVAIYAAFGALTGYSPLAAFRRALGTQELLVSIGRICRGAESWASAPLDLTLGLGGVVAVLAATALARSVPGFRSALATAAPARTVVAAAGLLAILLAGWLPQEMARVWIFLLPLVVVPSALELDRLPRPWPAILLAAQGVYLATLLARLELVGY